MYSLTIYFLKFTFFLLGGKFTITGLENLPKDKGSVVVCNHRSFFDVIYLGIGIWPTHIHYMAKKELFGNAFSNWLFHALNAFPVDRENPGPSVIKIPLQLLKQNKAVGIFPSGTRSAENTGLKKGATTIAQLGRAPIVPCRYDGPTNAKEWLARKPITITVFPIVEMNPDIKNREQQTEYLLNEIERVIS
ncbi:MAG: lysophospholipid acyltransferase family protein [Bacilli bacterium]